MTRESCFATFVVCTLAVTLVPGCGGDPAAPAPTSNGSHSEGEHGHDHGHAHASKGPHGGDLIELGNEEFHAELVHDEQAGTVSIYILDGAAKASVAIDATELTVNVKHEGAGEQFTLSASPDQGDPQGKSSRFVSSVKELGEELEHEHADAQLVATINGKQFRGKIEHHHDHEGGEHENHAK